MIVYPKLDENFAGVEALRKYINKGIEIQMLTENSASRVIKKYKKLFPSLEEITIHVPMNLCEFDYLLVNKDGYAYLRCLIKDLGEISKELGLHCAIVVHSTCYYSKLVKLATVDTLNSIIIFLEENNVTLLVENMPVLLEAPYRGCAAYDIVKSIDHSNVKMCLDVCHINCVLNTKKEDISFIGKMYTGKITDYVYQLHFANAGDNDGIVNPKTHSVVHTKEDFRRDIEILKILGVNDTRYVTEVIGNYDTRKEQIEEIQILQEYIKDTMKDVG